MVSVVSIVRKNKAGQEDRDDGVGVALVKQI